MKFLRNLLVVVVGLTLAGLLKAPSDDRLVADMRARGLIPAPIAIDTREKLGQTGLAIALGGLRSVIAPLLNLGTIVDWENQEWYELEQKYRTIVALQPHSRYYWITAAWQLHSNAYADLADRPHIPEGRRKEMQETMFWKGIAFLEEGVKNNPDDWRLWAELGGALSQVYRPRDLARASEAFRKAHEIGGNLQVFRQYLYALSRQPGREAEAWEAAKAMWSVEYNRRFVSPRTIFFTMQNWADPPAAERWTIEQIFGHSKLTLEQCRRLALTDLADYWFRQYEDYPVFGLRETINRLCEEFDLPAELHPLRFDWDREFSIHPLTGKSFRVDPATGRVSKRQWRSIWMDQIRDTFRPYLRSPAEGLVSLSLLWLRVTDDAPLPEVHMAIERLLLLLEVPERFNPLRHNPRDLLSGDPVTGEPFHLDPVTGEPFLLDPATGQPIPQTWQSIWTKLVRPELERWLQERNP